MSPQGAADQPDRGGARGGRGPRKWRPTDQLALQVLQGLPGGYLPWSKWSLRPAALLTVLNDILLNGRRTIVECGSGVSTVYMARLLRGTDARIRSLEGEESWVRAINGILAAEDLSNVATVLHAPLEPHDLALEDNLWYADGVAQELTSLETDLLLIDGPGGGAQRRMSRYPALPFFQGSLLPDSTVVLDDVNRPGEQRVIELWEEQTSLSFRVLNRLTIAVATSAPISHL